MKFLIFCYGISKTRYVNTAVPAVASSRTTLTELPCSDRLLCNANIQTTLKLIPIFK